VAPCSMGMGPKVVLLIMMHASRCLVVRAQTAAGA
jgi:hypothetical protein